MLRGKTENKIEAGNANQQAGGDIHGIPSEQHERMMKTALADLRVDLEEKHTHAHRANVAEHQLETQQLQNQIAEWERRLQNPEAAYKEYQAKIIELEQLLQEATIDIGDNRIADAMALLHAGDYTAADDIFAEVEKLEAMAVKRASRAAYGRGLVAEEQIRWADAACHYSKAARLDPTYDTMIKAGTFLWHAGQYRQALKINEDLVELSRKNFGNEDPKTAVALNNLAQCYQATGSLGKAELLMREAMAIDKAALGVDHTNYARCLNNLGGVLWAKGELAGAEPLMREAMAIDKKVLGADHTSYATDLNNLAALLQAKGDLAGAEPLMHEAMAIDKAALGADHTSYARDLNNLAILLRSKGDLAGAEPLMREAMAIDKAALGADHTSYARDLNNLAQLLQAKGDLAGAEPLMREAVAVVEVALGGEHPNSKIARGNLEDLLSKLPCRLPIANIVALS